MNLPSVTRVLPEPVRKRPLLLILAAIILVALLVLLLRPTKSNLQETAWHEVKRGDFTVSVVEGGTLTAVSEVVVRSEVEGTARIVWIVPEGSYVKKGDLLVELDSASAQDQVNQQQINFEKAKFSVEQSKATLEIQRSSTNSDFLAADLKLKFAKIDLDKYRQGQMQVDLMEASNRVVQTEAQLKVNEENFVNSTNLAARGYETKSRADSDRLSVLNSHNSLIVATNTLWMLQQFDIRKELEKLESDVMQAEQELDRVINQNKRKMMQYEADLLTQERTLQLNQEKLERDRKNLEASKIYAPQEGLVVYQVGDNRFSSESLIEGGAVVRNRQELLKLPDLSRMKVTIKVHESHVTMIRPGLPAFVILDSMPEQRFRGVVERVAPLPDTQSRWGNPNLKVYNTDVLLSDTVPNVKPGVSAKAEVIIAHIADTLSVPIQAVTTLRGNQVVYLQNGREASPQPVEVGMFNTKFIEITKGLSPGDRVLLSPPFDTQEKDLGGSVLAADEKPPIPSTNLPPVAPTAGGMPGVGNDSALGAPVARAGGDRRELPNLEELRKQYDKDGDGQLNEAEREAMRVAMAERFGAMGGPGMRGTNGPAGGGRFNREEMLKRFDTNGDGQLDETELAAMRASLGGGRGGEGRGPRRDGQTGPGAGAGSGRPGSTSNGAPVAGQ